MERTRSRNPRRWRHRFGFALLLIGAALTALMLTSAKWWFGYANERWLADLGDGTLYTHAVEVDEWSRPLVGWCSGKNPDYTASGVVRSWTWTWWTWGERKSSWS